MNRSSLIKFPLYAAFSLLFFVCFCASAAEKKASSTKTLRQYLIQIDSQKQALQALITFMKKLELSGQNFYYSSSDDSSSDYSLSEFKGSLPNKDVIKEQALKPKEHILFRLIDL